MTIEVELKKPITGKKPDQAFIKLAAGMSYAEAAAELHRDVETIKSHSKVIRDILHAKTMVQAVAIAVSKGIITITEKGGKTLLLALVLVGAGIPEDHEAGKIKVKTRIKIERRIDEA